MPSFYENARAARANENAVVVKARELLSVSARIASALLSKGVEFDYTVDRTSWKPPRAQHVGAWALSNNRSRIEPYDYRGSAPQPDCSANGRLLLVTGELSDFQTKTIRASDAPRHLVSSDMIWFTVDHPSTPYRIGGYETELLAMIKKHGIDPELFAPGRQPGVPMGIQPSGEQRVTPEMFGLPPDWATGPEY